MAASAHAGLCVEAELRASGVAAREVAGFVGSITTCVCYGACCSATSNCGCCFSAHNLDCTRAALFLLWAFVPEDALRAAGVTYYPAKWWALAAPSWLCAAVLYCYTAYGRRVRGAARATSRGLTQPACAA